MRVCIVGAGMQGAVAASVLARDPERPQIVLCDADLERAERIAAHIGGRRVATARIDATDVASLVAAMEGCDVVLNVVFFEMAAAVRRAALEAGCHYVDSAADSAFLNTLAFERRVVDDEAFKAAGLCAIAACGWAPGVSNVLARRAADRLDEVAELHVRIGLDRSLWVDPEAVAHAFRPHASPEVILLDYAEQSLHFTSGRPVRVPPFALAETYDFGGRIGTLVLTSHDHDESYTLPACVGKGITECTFRYPLNDQAATLVAMGMGDPERVVELRDGTRVKPFDVVMALVDRPADQTLLREGRAGLAATRDADRAVVVEATGRKDGAARSVRLTWYVRDCAELRLRLFEAYGSAQVWVALPMVVAARIAIRGDVPAGVTLPEQLDPERFLGGLQSMGYPLEILEHDAGELGPE